MNSRQLFAGACVMLGGLALIGSPASASPTNPNPKASCISAIANGNEDFGGVHGIGQFHNLAHPYGQAILETIHMKVGTCE